MIGFSIFVTVLKAAFAGKEDQINPEIMEYEFEFVVSLKYPFKEPMLLCHTEFTDPKVVITDNRDLYSEVIGEGGWRLPHTFATVAQLLPDFILEMYSIKDNKEVIGTFQLGNLYNLNNFNVSYDTMAVFLAQEQSDEDPKKFLTRYVAVTPGAILIFRQVRGGGAHGILMAWASLQSMARLRKNPNSPQFISIVFKPAEER